MKYLYYQISYTKQILFVGQFDKFGSINKSVNGSLTVNPAQLISNPKLKKAQSQTGRNQMCELSINKFRLFKGKNCPWPCRGERCILLVI